jgi:hypothetical protein
MRFRMPRPLHGWDEFVHEIVIVVIGVLLALGGAQPSKRFRCAAKSPASASRSIMNSAATSASIRA